jgi:hypothetical protein
MCDVQHGCSGFELAWVQAVALLLMQGMYRCSQALLGLESSIISGQFVGQVEVSGVPGFGVNAGKEGGLLRALCCRSFAHLVRVGLPIYVLDKEVVKSASHLASGVVERRLPAVATHHVRKDSGLFFFREKSF